MNRLAINTIVRATPIIRSTAPYRWQSSQTATNKKGGQGSNLTAGLAGGLTVLLGGFAWYHFSGTRQAINTAQEGVKKAEELKETVKDNTGLNTGDSTEALNYLRSTSASLIPGSAPFLGKIFDQIEEISNEHGDEMKKIFEETYNDFEKLANEGNLDPNTGSKAVEILQKRVQQIQDLANDAFDELISKNPELRDKLSEQYKSLKDMIGKAKDKKPEVQKLVNETSSQLADIFKDGDFDNKNIQKAKDLLKKKGDEAKKLVEDVKKK